MPPPQFLNNFHFSSKTTTAAIRSPILPSLLQRGFPLLSSSSLSSIPSSFFRYSLFPSQFLGFRSMSSSVRIVEVSPRDGLQNESFFVPTRLKQQLINRLSTTGLRTIEATSFVSPKWIPQLSDSAEIMAFLSTHPQKENIVFPVLVPNLRGLNEAIKWGVSEVAIFGSASEGFSKANINCSVEESLARFREVCELALQKGIRVRGYVLLLFGCWV